MNRPSVNISRHSTSGNQPSVLHKRFKSERLNVNPLLVNLPLDCLDVVDGIAPSLQSLWFGGVTIVKYVALVYSSQCLFLLTTGRQANCAEGDASFWPSHFVFRALHDIIIACRCLNRLLYFVFAHCFLILFLLLKLSIYLTLSQWWLVLLSTLWCSVDLRLFASSVTWIVSSESHTKNSN